MQFVGRDPAKRVFEAPAIPARCVHDHAEMSVAAVEFELIEGARLDGRVDERVVARRGERIGLFVMGVD